MRVVVTNCKNPKLEQELIAATKFYTKHLLSKQMYKHIFVEIILTKKIEDLGNCCVTYYNDWYKPREFEIQLKQSRSLNKTLSTLAHELVHVKQFAKGELNISNNKWRGEAVNSDIVPYHELPWEIEASASEHILFSMYKEHRQQLMKD